MNTAFVNKYSFDDSKYVSIYELNYFMDNNTFKSIIKNNLTTLDHGIIFNIKFVLNECIANNLFNDHEVLRDTVDDPDDNKNHLVIKSDYQADDVFSMNFAFDNVQEIVNDWYRNVQEEELVKPIKDITISEYDRLVIEFDKYTIIEDSRCRYTLSQKKELYLASDFKSLIGSIIYGSLKLIRTDVNNDDEEEFSFAFHINKIVNPFQPFKRMRFF